MQSRGDRSVKNLLDLTEASLMPHTILIKKLLDIACRHAAYLKPNTMKKLISMGAILKDDHAQVFEQILENNIHWVEDDLLAVINLFKNNRVTIPAQYLFLDSSNLKANSLIINNTFNEVSKTQWIELEKRLVSQKNLNILDRNQLNKQLSKIKRCL